MKQARVLIVDRPASHALYATMLAPLDAVELRFAGGSEEASRQFVEAACDLMIVALSPPELDGLALLRQVQRDADPVPVIVVTEQPSLDSAAACLRGANDYLPAPLEAADLVASVRRLLAGRRLVAEHELLSRQVERPYGFDEFIGASPAMRQVYSTIEQVAGSDVAVLIVGETGTGKELVARSIHQRSRRAGKRFVPVDCGAIPENLLESEFFGHERGAFTGAEARRIGLLEFADEGTFFLDELGELPLLLQAKLLRTLQEGKIRRVGGREEIAVDVRIVAATGRNLEQMIREQRFREDLYYRINVVRIDLPPLNQRGDDIGLLAEHFAVRSSREMGKDVTTITPEAFQVLFQYGWPGNVRELQNVIRRAIALSQDSRIGLDDLPDALVNNAGERSSTEGMGFFQLREEKIARFEREYLTALLRRHHGDVKNAAQEAKVPRGTLYRLMKNHGLEGADFRN